jgi:hypothetical protein
MKLEMQNAVAAKLAELKATTPAPVGKIEKEIRQWRETSAFCRSIGNTKDADDCEAAARQFVEILPPRDKASYTPPAWQLSR